MKQHNFLRSRIGKSLAVSVLALGAAHALPASGALPFEQSAGWFMGPPTAVVTLPGNPATGGVGFFTAPVWPTLPPNTFSTIGWGCSSFLDATTCAVPVGPWPLYPAALATTTTDPFGRAGRSALRVTGKSGDINTGLDFAPIWRDVTLIEQFNKIIFGNTMDTAEVHSFLTLGGTVVDAPAGSTTTVERMETPNFGTCPIKPSPSAPANPIGTICDDFAFVQGLDLSPIPLTPEIGVKFRLNADPFVPGVSGSLVCPGKAAGQPDACGDYDGAAGILIYSGEDAINQISIQAQLFPITPQNPLPLFVVGDCEYDQAKLKKGQTGVDDATAGIRDVGDTVNFWGSQWWKNNCMSVLVENGYPAFKGFATNVDLRPTPTHPCGAVASSAGQQRASAGSDRRTSSQSSSPTP